jgi:hypothetical protein
LSFRSYCLKFLLSLSIHIYLSYYFRLLLSLFSVSISSTFPSP